MKKYLLFFLAGIIALTLFIATNSCHKENTPPPPPITGTVSDVEGNVYKTVVIGSQVWMAENLRVTKYRNGDTIPNVIDVDKWINLTSGSYCDYDNDPWLYSS